eukprot:scaffold224208_cov19-Prasinocladus_malaysianus.AAC.1
MSRCKLSLELPDESTLPLLPSSRLVGAARVRLLYLHRHPSQGAEKAKTNRSAWQQRKKAE